MKRPNDERGFTLIEMLVGLVIASVITFGLFNIFTTTNRAFNRGTENLDGQQNARAALNWIATELRGAKGFQFVSANEVTFLTDIHQPNQARTFRLDTEDQDGDGDTSELLLIRNPNDDGTPGVFTDEIAVGIDSLAFIYRSGSGATTTSRAAVQEVEIAVFASGRLGANEDAERSNTAHQVGMATRVSCRNLGKSVPTLGDALAPDNPTGITVSLGCGTATVGWAANSEEDLAGYFLHYAQSGGSPYEGTDADQGPSPIYVGNSTSYTLTGLSMTDTYYFNLQAVDAADNYSLFGSEVSGTPADDYPPAAPTNLTGRVTGNDEITLEWAEGSDWDVALYRVGWSEDIAGSFSTAETPYPYIVISGLNPDGAYEFVVVAIDGCGNESTASTELLITLVPCDQDVTFPEIPDAVATLPGNEFVKLTWNRVSDTDVIGYQIYFIESGTSSGSTLLVGNVQNYTVYGLENGQEYQFQVAAMDGCGHVGGFSGLLGESPISCGPSNLPPDTPVNVIATDLGIGDTVKLAWTRASENDVLGYRLHVGTQPGVYGNAMDVGDAIFWTIDGLVAGVEHYFAVSAYDVCGGESPISGESRATPTWGCICPPVVTTQTPANFAILESTVYWTVNAAACSTLSMNYVEFQIDGTTRYVDYSAPFEYGDFGTGWQTTLENDGPHTLIAVGVDDNGCEVSDTTSVFLDNSAHGLSCVAVTGDAQLDGPFDETVTVRVENLSLVDTYKISALVLEWDGSAIAPTQFDADGFPIWTSSDWPSAFSGDTLELPSLYEVMPDSHFDLAVSFWDNPSTSVPDLQLANRNLRVTFLGTPIAECGSYAMSLTAVACTAGVSIVSVNSSNSYEVAGIPSVGDQYYTDRTYTFTYLPSELDGAVQVKTPNNDKNKGDSHALVLAFDQDVAVYIAYDPRGTPPNWIKNNYTDTGLTIGVTDSGTSTLGLWRREATGGERTFKGNKAFGWSGSVGTNYIIFVVCLASAGGA